MGEGVIDPLAGISELSVPDSDFPHGIVCFHASSLSVFVDESSMSVNLTVIRGAGSIGELMAAVEVVLFPSIFFS